MMEARNLHQWYNHANEAARSATDTGVKVWLSRDEASKFVREEIDTVLFDCDGVLYRTLDLCPGAAECIRTLMEDQSKNVFFVTNNSATNRRQLQDKLSTLLGLEALRTEQMVSSAYCCARYLQLQQQQRDLDGDGHKQKPIRRVHVIGSIGLCEELTEAGFEVSGGPGMDSDTSSMTRQDLADYPFDEHPIDALVVGHDVAMNFRKLAIADNLLLRNPDAVFVASNEDSFDLVGSDARHIPGNGATVKALEYCSKRKAINVGKPSRTLAQLLQTEHADALAGDPSRCLFVGDRLDTDIRFAVDNGMKSLLVMTGVTTAQTMKDLGGGTEEEPLPDFILPFIGMMV